MQELVGGPEDCLEFQWQQRVLVVVACHLQLVGKLVFELVKLLPILWAGVSIALTTLPSPIAIRSIVAISR